jgi:hypothetical protein
MGVGSIGISSSAQSGIEIVADGIPSPDHVKTLIYDCMAGSTPAPPEQVLKTHPQPVSPAPAPRPAPQAVVAPKPQKESYFASDEFKESAQAFLDRATYIASLRWVAQLPDWAQPIVWGLLVSVPVVLMLILAFQFLRGR